MSLREYTRLTRIQIILWLKTYFHPEALGGGDRRNHPRRSTDRRRERIQKFWLLVLTVFIVWYGLTIRHDQGVANDLRLDGTRQRCELTHRIIDTAVHLGVPSHSHDLDDLRNLLRDCRILESKLESQ